MAIVRATIEQRAEERQLQRILSTGVVSSPQQLFVNRTVELPRAFAIIEIQHGLQSLSNLFGIVSVLIDRQGEQLTRLEEGTLTMERQIEASQRTLSRARLRAAAGSLATRLAMIGVGALLLFLLLV